jgi:hypothetical protein
MPRADAAPLGLKKNDHPRFYKQFAPPGLGPQNPLASAVFSSFKLLPQRKRTEN